MSELVVKVQHVADIMTEIMLASGEQSEGIEQVNNAIAHMDTATQQNAALVEEAAAAAESLQDQAKTLTSLVSVFKLSNNDNDNDNDNADVHNSLGLNNAQNRGEVRVKKAVLVKKNQRQTTRMLT